MSALARMASASEFFDLERKAGHVPFRMHLDDYMDFAERYADYVCDHEKFIDRTGLATVEAIENGAYTAPLKPQYEKEPK